MKTVVHIVNENVVRQDVPDDWIKCSVLGEYRPPEEFRPEGGKSQTRTNCTRAYLMPLVEWDHHKSIEKKLKGQLESELKKLHHELIDKSAGVSIDTLITELLKLKETNPEARIVIDYDGELCDPSISNVKSYTNVYSL